MISTVQRETFTKGKVDESAEWIRQSLTNQYSQISAFIMLSNRQMSSNSSVKVYFVKAVEVRIRQIFTS